MIGRLALRSLTAHPVRSAVLAAGFGVGVAVMAILLGVAEVVLQQAQAPALVGGGDVLIRLSEQTPARLVLSGTLQADALRDRVRVAAPFHSMDLFLLVDDSSSPVSDTPQIGAGTGDRNGRARSEIGQRSESPDTANHAPSASPGESAEHGSPAPDQVRSSDTPASLPWSGRSIRVAARGGIPSLERALEDEETGGIDAWRDSPADVAWTRDTPDKVLRHIDRFHPIPDAPRWEHSWAEWLYFNGRGPDARFYLTFMVGPRTDTGRRPASVRLQLDREGNVRTWGAAAALTDEEVARAPDLTIGGSSVRLVGMQYRIHLDLEDARGSRIVGELTLEASAGRLVPPVEVTGAGGWRTGYVVPVMSGRLDGTLTLDEERLSLDAGTGYHDHNWGFWEGVTWQWGQVQHEDLSFIFGRVFAPPEAADPARLPGFVGALGPDGPIGYATDVRISESNDEQGRPDTIVIQADGPALELTFRFSVGSVAATFLAEGGPLGSGPNLLQMRGQYDVMGRLGDRSIAFAAPGAAETFRGE